MKHTKIILIVLLVVFLCTPAFADKGVTLTLPNGTVIPLDGLTSEEVKRMSELVNKTMKTSVSDTTMRVENKVVQIATDAISDPAKLDAWRKMITGTIKDTCSDLNVAVNEFIKTPVGLGVSALILYNVAGKDVLGAGAKMIHGIVIIVLLIPLWFIIMGILLFLRKKYLSTITVYSKKKEIIEADGKHSLLYTDPEIKIAYPWHSNDARGLMAVMLVLIGVVITVVFVVMIVQ
jgi:hypothetical protein